MNHVIIPGLETFQRLMFLSINFQFIVIAQLPVLCEFEVGLGKKPFDENCKLAMDALVCFGSRKNHE